MSLCANQYCRAPLGESYWPGGTCSAACSRAVGAIASGRPDPDDEGATGSVLLRNRDIMEQWERAAEYHHAMPAILIYRGKGFTEARIARMVGLTQARVSQLLAGFHGLNS